MDNFLMLDSVYGKFILPRHYTPGPPTPNPATEILRTGRTHIEDELQNILTVVNTLDENSVIVDAGANLGFFTIPVAQAVKEKGSKLISFEPQKQLFYALGGTIALNELRNVYLYNLGIGDNIGIARVSEVDYNKDSDYGMVTIKEVEDETNVFLSYDSVQVITLDSMELPALDFYKLDIEGYECAALKGSIETISKYRPWIWIEYNMVGKDNIKKELASLEDYEYIIVDWQNMLCAPKERIVSSGLNLKGNA
jgi:FkbM family methyltransferase